MSVSSLWDTPLGAWLSLGAWMQFLGFSQNVWEQEIMPLIFVNYLLYLWISYWGNILLHKIHLLSFDTIFTASTVISGCKCIICGIHTVITPTNYFNIHHFAQWLLPKFYVRRWRQNSLNMFYSVFKDSEGIKIMNTRVTPILIVFVT